MRKPHQYKNQVRKTETFCILMRTSHILDEKGKKICIKVLMTDYGYRRLRSYGPVSVYFHAKIFIIVQCNIVSLVPPCQCFQAADVSAAVKYSCSGFDSLRHRAASDRWNRIWLEKYPPGRRKGPGIFAWRTDWSRAILWYTTFVLLFGGLGCTETNTIYSILNSLSAICHIISRCRDQVISWSL